MKRILHIFLIIFFFVGIAFAGPQQTSSTLASAIITNARAYLNDTSSNPFWNDTELLQWLNNGTVDLVARSHCLETTEDIDLIADQTEYTISTNYIVVKAVQYVSAASVSKAMIRGAPESVGLVSNVGQPVYWYDWAGKLGAYPALTSVTTEKLTVYLVLRPAAVTSTDPVTVPAIYDKALTMYVVAQAWAKDRQMGKYAQAMSVYNAELDRYRKDLLAKPKEPAQ